MGIRAVAVIFLASVLSWASPAGAEHRPNPHAELDCRFCHAETPEPGETLEAMIFWRAAWDDPKLCLRCHDPKQNLHPILVKPGPDRLGTRPPDFLPLGKTENVAGMVVCTTCHFIHAPSADYALLRGLPGAQEVVTFPGWQDLCRQCHAEGLAQRSPHAGDRRACVFCHSAMPEPGEPVALTAGGDHLCRFCHGGLRPEHYAGANPFGGTPACRTCHDPHLAKDHPARLKPGYYRSLEDKVTLNPHYRRSLCFACHTEEEGFPLRTKDTVALCNRCHFSPEIPGDIHPLRKVPAGITIPVGWPLAKGFLACGTCHLPGHPKDRGSRKFLRGGPYASRNDICFLCHPTDYFSGHRPHRDAAGGKEGCLFCHAKNPEEGGEDTFIADVNILCLRCHAPEPHPTGRDHTMTLPPEARQTVPPILPLGRGGRITCATCHDPHRGEGQGQKLRGAADQGPFCSQCHKF